MNFTNQIRVKFIRKNGESDEVIVNNFRSIRMMKFIFNNDGVFEETLLSGARTKKDALIAGKKYLERIKEENKKNRIALDQNDKSN